MQIDTRNGLGETTVDVTVNNKTFEFAIDLQSSLQEAIDKYGEDCVFVGWRRYFVSAVRQFVRRIIVDDELDEEAVQEAVRSFRPRFRPRLAFSDPIRVIAETVVVGDVSLEEVNDRIQEQIEDFRQGAKEVREHEGSSE